MVRTVLRVFFVVGFAFLLAGGGTFVWLYAGYVRPGVLAGETTFIVPKGSNVATIVNSLNEADLIEASPFFYFGVYLEQSETKLKAGEFLIPAKASVKDIISILRKGETVVRRLSVAEGLTTSRILAQLSRVDSLTGKLPQLIAEGSLLPETYYFSYGDTKQSMIERMQKGMQETAESLWEARDKTIPLKTVKEAIILASIVEKETGLAHERGRVASVFINRLRLGMPLQSDPTVVYALTEGKRALGRSLRRKDLDVSSPYNTYRIKGLPPTPISNPGIDALSAVMKPVYSKDLYFVADGTGGHAFARTLKEHNYNVAKWIKFKKNAKKDSP